MYVAPYQSLNHGESHPDLLEKSFRLRKGSKNIEDLSHKNVSFILKIKFYGKNLKNLGPDQTNMSKLHLETFIGRVR